jgi:hypothetical protein
VVVRYGVGWIWCSFPVRATVVRPTDEPLKRRGWQGQVKRAQCGCAATGRKGKNCAEASGAQLSFWQATRKAPRSPKPRASKPKPIRKPKAEPPRCRCPTTRRSCVGGARPNGAVRFRLSACFRFTGSGLRLLPGQQGYLQVIEMHLTGTLQEADYVTGPWSEVSSASAPPYRVTPVGSKLLDRTRLQLRHRSKWIESGRWSAQAGRRSC